MWLCIYIIDWEFHYWLWFDYWMIISTCGFNKGWDEYEIWFSDTNDGDFCNCMMKDYLVLLRLLNMVWVD